MRVMQCRNNENMGGGHDEKRGYMLLFRNQNKVPSYIINEVLGIAKASVKFLNTIPCNGSLCGVWVKAHSVEILLRLYCLYKAMTLSYSNNRRRCMKHWQIV